jgi:hypothetical protein
VQQHAGGRVNVQVGKDDPAHSKICMPGVHSALLGGKHVFANAAQGAYEIVRKIFPFGARRDAVVGIAQCLVVRVTADIANVFHQFSSFLKFISLESLL